MRFVLCLISNKSLQNTAKALQQKKGANIAEAGVFLASRGVYKIGPKNVFQALQTTPVQLPSSRVSSQQVTRHRSYCKRSWNIPLTPAENSRNK